jgi:hypothetical protein
MICPKCKNEFNSQEESVCPICSFDLNVALEGKWELLLTVGDEIEAELIKGHLESEEIPCAFHSHIDSTRLITLGGESVVKIYTPEAFIDLAKEALLKIDFDLEESEMED